MQSSSHESDELRLKQALADQVNNLISSSGLSQSEVAARIGSTQPKVSQIRRHNLKNISVSKLLHALVALEQHVDIVIRPSLVGTAISVSVVA